MESTSEERLISKTPRKPLADAGLRMIRFLSQQGIQERLASRFLAAAVRLDRDKDCINFGQLLRIIQAENPASVRFAVHVENAKIHGVNLLA